MLFRLFAFLCLAGLSFAELPRPLVDVPILYPNGQKLSIKTKYRGRVVVVVMIATTCNSCVKTIDLLTKMQQQFGARGLVVVGAVVDEQNPKFTLGPWLTRHRPPFEFGYLEKAELVKLADIPPGKRPFVPILMFIDKKGQVRYQAYGDDPFMAEKDKAIPAIINSLLMGQEGPMTATQQVGPDGKPLPPPATKK